MAKTLFALILLGVTQPATATAHDAWIQVKEGERDNVGTFDISFHIGHAENADIWNISPESVARFFAVDEHQQLNIIHRVEHAREHGSDAVKLKRDNATILELSTFQSYSYLESETFNNYAAEEGITPIVSDRIENGHFNTPGRELYSRHMKALVIPSDLPLCDAALPTHPLGQLLEIIPLGDPYAWHVSGFITVEVQYAGQPLPGATLHINSLAEDTSPKKQITNEFGRTIVEQPTTGDWYLHTAWARPDSRGHANADYSTAFASFSFPSLENSIGHCDNERDNLVSEDLESETS